MYIHSTVTHCPNLYISIKCNIYLGLGIDISKLTQLGPHPQIACYRHPRPAQFPSESLLTHPPPRPGTHATCHPHGPAHHATPTVQHTHHPPPRPTHTSPPRPMRLTAVEGTAARPTPARVAANSHVTRAPCHEAWHRECYSLHEACGMAGGRIPGGKTWVAGSGLWHTWRQTPGSGLWRHKELLYFLQSSCVCGFCRAYRSSL